MGDARDLELDLELDQELDLELDQESRARRSRVRFATAAVLLASTVLGVGYWMHGQVPAVAALDVTAMSPVLSPSVLNGQAGLVTQRLSDAAGRTLEAIAEDMPGPSANPIESDAPIVAGAQAASTEYAETLARLSEAEMAAAQQLATSEQEAAMAEADRRRAAEDLASEEEAAAREVDAAIAAAIAAAQAETAYSAPMWTDPGSGGDAGTIPTGRETDIAEVRELVRRFFPPEQVGNAMAVSRCESGHSNAIGAANTNGTRDFGVFQINDGGTLQAALRRIGVPYSSISDARAKALDPALNVRMARVIWDTRGWQPWVCAAKMKVVAGLYQRTPGPLYGKYDDSGRRL